MRIGTVIAVIVFVFGLEAVGQTRSRSFRWDRQRITSKLTNLSGVRASSERRLRRRSPGNRSPFRRHTLEGAEERNVPQPERGLGPLSHGRLRRRVRRPDPAFRRRDVAAASERNHPNPLRDLGRFSVQRRCRRPLGNDRAVRRQGLARGGKRDSSRPARGVGLLGSRRVCRRSSRHAPPLRRQLLERGRGRIELEMAVQCSRRHVSLGYVCCGLAGGNWRRSADGGFPSLRRPGLDGRPGAETELGTSLWPPLQPMCS